MTLTARTIEAAKPIPGKRVALPDGKVQGLELIVQETGAKSWALRAYLHGQRLRLTLGKYPALSLADARALAAAKLKLIAKGVDPRDDEKQRARAAQERKASSFAAVVDDFITLYARPRNRSWSETRQVLTKYAVPLWSDWPLKDIERRHVAILIDTLRNHPATQRKVLAATRKLFNWAIEREMMDRNPAVGIRAARVKVRERVLNDDEIRSLWLACDDIGYPFGPFVRLLLLTGCRRSELAGATRADVDRGHATLVIPGERYKTGRPHAVPLVPAAMDILDRLPVTGDFLFTTTGDKPISGFSKMLKRLIEAAGVAFSLHDLRRTVRTGLSRLGVEHHVAERVLGHAQGGVAAHYDHHGYLAEKRRALGLWADHLQGLLDGAPAENVVMLRR